MESMLRRQLKEWQKGFREKHGREPSKKDIQKHPEIASIYDTWHAIRGAAPSTKQASSSSSKAAASSSDASRPAKKPRTDSHSAGGPPSTPTRNAQKTGSRSQQGGRVSDSFEPKLNPFKTPTKNKSKGPSAAAAAASPSGLASVSLTPRRRTNPFATPTKSSAASRSNPSTPGSARSIVIVPQSPSRRWVTETAAESPSGSDAGRFDYAPSPSKLRDLISSHARYSPNTRRRGAASSSGTAATWGLARDDNEEALRAALTPRSKARKRLKGEAVPPTPLSHSTRENKDRIGRAVKSRGSGKLSFGMGLGGDAAAGEESADGEADDVLGSSTQGQSQGKLSSFMRSISAARAAQQGLGKAPAATASHVMDDDEEELGPSPSREKSRSVAKAKFASLFDDDGDLKAVEEGDEDEGEAPPLSKGPLGASARASFAAAARGSDGEVDHDDEFGDDSLPQDTAMLDAAEAQAIEAAEREEREAARRRREERRRLRDGERKEVQLDVGGEAQEGEQGVTLRAYRMFERSASGGADVVKLSQEDGPDEEDLDDSQDDDEDEDDIVSFALRRSPTKPSVASRPALSDVAGPSSRPISTDDADQVSADASRLDASQAMLDSTLRLCLASPKGGRARLLKARRDGERLRGILGDESKLEALRIEDELAEGGDENEGGKGKGRVSAQGPSNSWGEAKLRERISATAKATSKGDVKLSKKEIRKMEEERRKEEERRRAEERLKPMKRSARAGVADDEDEGYMDAGHGGEWWDGNGEEGDERRAGRGKEHDSDWESGVDESDEEYGLGDGEMDLDDVV